MIYLIDEIKVEMGCGDFKEIFIFNESISHIFSITTPLN